MHLNHVISLRFGFVFTIVIDQTPLPVTKIPFHSARENKVRVVQIGISGSFVSHACQWKYTHQLCWYERYNSPYFLSCPRQRKLCCTDPTVAHFRCECLYWKRRHQRYLYGNLAATRPYSIAFRKLSAYYQGNDEIVVVPYLQTNYITIN